MNLGILLAPTLWTLAQVEQIKYERAERIKTHIRPSPIADFVVGCDFIERVIYYCEYSQDGIILGGRNQKRGDRLSIYILHNTVRSCL